MPIIIAIASLILLALLFGPQWWVRHVLARYGVERADLPGTGETSATGLPRLGMRDNLMWLRGGDGSCRISLMKGSSA